MLQQAVAAQCVFQCALSSAFPYMLRILTRVRVLQAQTRVAKLAITRYYRCLDELTGAEYYFDPKTGKTWLLCG